MKRYFFTIFTCTSFCLLCLSLVSCKDEQKTVKPIVITFKKEGELTIRKASNDSIIKAIDIEIADNDYETQTGMMYRDSMEENQGMLFVFPNEQYHAFYMKNTKIPLDIVFINSNKTIVNIHKNARPYDESPLPSSAPIQYVLEVNAGLSDTWGLEAGDRVEFSYQ